ncbi:MAG TPA: DUF2934 domain-containing protein [Candidatus Sulfotelmatobacter sp.]|nr:DUF2934 domain-containing protein [Candidatus Sulfotelmatobacter sp.]
MTSKSQAGQAQSVPVVEADILDRMTETDGLVAQRAYEIYQSRGGVHGSDQDDWFKAEQDVLGPLAIERDLIDGALQLKARVPGFAAKDLEVVIGHRRAVICGVHHTDSNPPAGARHKDRKIMRIVDLPFDVNPVMASAVLQGGTLQVVLPRSQS